MGNDESEKIIFVYCKSMYIVILGNHIDTFNMYNLRELGKENKRKMVTVRYLLFIAYQYKVYYSIRQSDRHKVIRVCSLYK